MKTKIMHTMFRLLQIAFIALLFSCTRENAELEFSPNGAWELQKIESPSGYEYDYRDKGSTWLRIYDDSCIYSCQITLAPNGTMVSPDGIMHYFYKEREENDILYLQAGNTYPFVVVDDSTIQIQERGSRFTWRRCENIDEERIRAIVDVIGDDMKEQNEMSHRYVFSNRERNLQTTNHTLVYLLALIVVVLMGILNYAYNLHKKKELVEAQLKQIEQEREMLPDPVRQAMDGVVADFQQSDFYISIRKRIALGERLKKDDWQDIEDHFKRVYPRFSSTLLSLFNMSQVEYQVCLLIKLNVTPSEMANVLCKDVSSISSTRSRLYRKVFGKKGSSKDWDDFVASL